MDRELRNDVFHEFETGIPYAIGYRCPNCGIEIFGHHRPFCGACGHRWPSAKDMVKQQRVIYSDTYQKERSRDLEEINWHLKTHSGKEIALWSYGVGHSNLELRLRHSGKPAEACGEQWLNTVVQCHMTSQVIIPQLRWTSTSQVQSSGEDQVTFFDLPAGVKIVCKAVSVTFDVSPGL